MLSEVIAAGDEMAIMPSRGSTPAETLEIVQVAFAHDYIIRLVDSRVYSRSDRSGLTPRSLGYIETATDAHHAALQERDC